MAQPYVVIVILNTNRRTDTLACLSSLAQSTHHHYQVIVLDNDSSDGSVAAIRTAFPRVQIIELTQNLGYAGNNNVGIEAALVQGADWVFVLNEDTVVDPACIAALVQVGERDARTGILGPMVYHHDEPNMIQSAGGRLGRYWQSLHIAKDEPDLGQFQEPQRVEWVSGCGIFVRRAVIEQVGMLDARFFYYWEETEWCVRASHAGWRIVHVPQAKLWHKGVQRNYQPKPSLTYYSTRNRLLLLSKHHAPTIARVHVWFQIVRTLASWSLRPKWRSMVEHRNAMWRGMLDFLYQRWGQMPS
jgi:GT2 family glycosyltransferase